MDIMRRDFRLFELPVVAIVVTPSGKLLPAQNNAGGKESLSCCGNNLKQIDLAPSLYSLSKDETSEAAA